MKAVRERTNESRRNPAELMIRGMTAADVDRVVLVHTRTMRDFFLTSLGPAFLTLYYGSLLEDERAIAQVGLNEGGCLVGFVVGTLNPHRFYSRLLLRRWWGFSFAALGAVAKHPSIALRLMRALRFPGGQPDGQAVAGLYSIAVADSHQGIGLGRALVRAFLEEAGARGATAVYLHADAVGNERWNELLLRLGWTLQREFATPDGRPMNEYWFDLEEQ